MRKITLKGMIFSGQKMGSYFVNMPWARRQFKEKLGFNPYPGTLNLRLCQEKNTRELREFAGGIEIESPEGFYGGRCFKAVVQGNVRGALVVPDAPDYPSDVLEILAPVNLREELGLKDGMELTVTVWLK